MKNGNLLLIHAVLLAVLWTVALATNGLGGGGDSLTHYFMAKIAWNQPLFFLDLWGKPVFTLLSSPFAQLGFASIKLFNIFCGVLASLFSCLVAKRLNKSWHWAILPMAFIAPAYYTYLFSGLTEPLAALLAITAVWLCLSKNVAWGFALASLLPFARSEVQIFLLFFLTFGLLNGHYKKLPLLFTGHLIYALLSFLAFGDPLRAFDSPYDTQGSVYGSGDWFHYINNLNNMLALPGLLLAGLGLVQFFRRWFFLKNINWRREPWLVHAPFFALLGGHTLVWTLGIYGSAGLERTLIAAFPFLWIIMLDGVILLKDISSVISKKAAFVLPLLALALQAYLTVSSPLARYYRNAHLNAGDEYLFFKDEVADFIQTSYPAANQFVMDKPEMAVALDCNFINPDDRMTWSMYQRTQDVPTTTLWIYDSHYVPVQYGIDLETIRKEKKLREVKSFEGPEGWVYVIFEKPDQ